MKRLVDAIDNIRAKLEVLRRHSLKETSTRTIIIDPLLEALGWDIRDPNEVELEYPTVDGKSVDYALKINTKAAILVEAKALDDPLDVKTITQVVGYAANDGIVWCILTNGMKWKVYRSIEECPAPEKLMFEVSLDPRDSVGSTVQQLAQQMRRFSKEEIATGTLDTVGEQTFTDGRIRKALDTIMRNPGLPLINMVKKALGDPGVSPQKVRESLARIWGVGPTTKEHAPSENTTAKRRKKMPQVSYDEKHHLDGKPQEVVELFRAVDRLCLSMKPEAVERQFKAKYVSYACNDRIFTSVHVQQGGLRVWLYLKYTRLRNPPSFARDVTNVGHWGTGDLELDISNLSQLEEAAALIRMSLESRT